MLSAVLGCGGTPSREKTVTMRLRPDCQFLVMPEECMEAVVVERKPAARKSIRPGWE